MECIIDTRELQFHRHQAFVQRHPTIDFAEGPTPDRLHKPIPNESCQFKPDLILIKVSCKCCVKVSCADILALIPIRYQRKEVYAQL